MNIRYQHVANTKYLLEKSSILWIRLLEDERGWPLPIPSLLVKNDEALAVYCTFISCLFFRTGTEIAAF